MTTLVSAAIAIRRRSVQIFIFKVRVIMIVSKFVQVTAFIFLLSLLTFAQNTAVTGTVEDQNKSAVAEATVILRNTKTGFERIATTGPDGKFSFTDVGSGAFAISAAAPGFARSTELSALFESSNLITLEPSPVKEEVTVVSGSRQEELRDSLSTKVDVLTRDDIKTSGAETVGEALRNVPGVLTRRGSETTPPTGEQIQGIDSRQVLVLLDGQPVTGARGVKSGIINLDRQQVTQLESIEVVKGASSALYGSDAIGGVVNLRTREQTEPFTATLAAAAGNFGIVDLTATSGFVKDKLSGFFTFGRHKNNGFDLFPADFTTDGSGYHRYDAYGKLKYQFTPNFSVLVFANSYWNNAKGRVVGEPSPGNFNGRQIIDVDDESQDYGITGDWAIDGRTNLQVRGYYSRFDEIYRNTTATGVALPDGNLFERYGKFDTTFTRILGERQLLQAGVEFTGDRYNGTNRLQNDVGEANTQVVWAQDKISIIPRLTVTVGARVDNHSEFGTAVSPKFAASYKLADYANLRVSWGKGFRAPDLGQLFYNFRNPLFGYQVLGNRNLEPEYSSSWQFGGEFYWLNRKARLGINFYRNDVKDLINSVNLGTVVPDADTTTIAGEQAQVAALLSAAGADPSSAQYVTSFPTMVFAYLNTANVFTQGVEADASYVLPWGFIANGAYTFLEAEDENTGRTLTGRHKHQGFARLAYTNSRYGITANFRGMFYSKWWTTATRKAEGFAIYDVYAAKELPKGFEVYGVIDNLFNSQDPNTGLASPTNPAVALPIDRADAGRVFRIGVRWTLGEKN